MDPLCQLMTLLAPSPAPVRPPPPRFPADEATHVRDTNPASLHQAALVAARGYKRVCLDLGTPSTLATVHVPQALDFPDLETFLTELPHVKAFIGKKRQENVPVFEVSLLMQAAQVHNQRTHLHERYPEEEGWETHEQAGRQQVEASHAASPYQHLQTTLNAAMTTNGLAWSKINTEDMDRPTQLSLYKLFQEGVMLGAEGKLLAALQSYTIKPAVNDEAIDLTAISDTCSDMYAHKKTL